MAAISGFVKYTRSGTISTRQAQGHYICTFGNTFLPILSVFDWIAALRLHIAVTKVRSTTSFYKKCYLIW